MPALENNILYFPHCFNVLRAAFDNNLLATLPFIFFSSCSCGGESKFFILFSWLEYKVHKEGKDGHFFLSNAIFQIILATKAINWIVTNYFSLDPLHPGMYLIHCGLTFSIWLHHSLGVLGVFFPVLIILRTILGLYKSSL